MIRAGILFVAILLLAAHSYADDSDRPLYGMDLNKGNALQANMCSLKPGQSREDYEEVVSEYIEWSKDNEVEVLVIRLDPLFGGPDPSSGSSFEWIDLLVSSYPRSGETWTKWLGTKDGQKLNAKWQSIADCDVTINPMFNLFADPEVIAMDDRIMTFRWCTPQEGVTTDQLIERHNKIREQRADDSPIGGWSVVYPGLGNRNTPGRFMHMMTFASPAELMASENYLANEGGWRNFAEYQRDFASCTAANAYVVKVRNRPE